MSALAANYDAWNVNEKDFPRSGRLEDQLNFLVRYGILAPSTHNTQPWQFEIYDNELVITPDKAGMLPEADPEGRNLQISIGCCEKNIEVAAEHFGLEASVSWSPKKVIMQFSPGRNKPNANYFDSITERYSNKLAYDGTSLKDGDRQKLSSVTPPTSCKLVLVEDPTQIQSIASMQKTATMSYANNRKFFHELSNWLKPSDTDDEKGMPGFVVGLSTPKSKVLRVLVKKFKPAVKLLAKKDAQVINSSSAVAFITTEGDTPAEWFEAGQYYEALALCAANTNLSMTPMAAIIENKMQRTQVMKLLNTDRIPQLFFRVGYSKQAPYHTPRQNIVFPIMKSQSRLAKSLGTDIETKQVSIGKYQINYIKAGTGQPVILLHGANIGWAQWYKNIAKLAEEFQVYAIDLPGAGSSTKVDFHDVDFRKDYAEVVDQFIQKLELSKVDIIGSSFGGWIAMVLAVQQKPYIRKIILSNPLGLTTHMPMKFRPVSVKPFAKFLTKTALRPKRSNKNLEKFMRDVFADKNLELKPEFIDYFYELSETSHNLLFISRLAHYSGMRPELFLKQKLGMIKTPVLVIWGKQDPLMPYDSVEPNLHLIPDVKVKILNDIGHMPPIEAPIIFNQMATKFLKS